MAQIRPKQIKLDTIGDLITADAAEKGEVLPLGAVNTVLTSDLGTTNKPIWSYVTALRDSSGDLALDVISGGTNYLTLTGGNAGTNPKLTAVGVDTNLDIELTPKGTGEVLVPVSYTPVSSNALVTKSYADGVATGLDVKNSVRLATSASGELSGFTYNPGNEPTGNVWTGVTSATFDGESVADGDRVLIKDALDARGNGIFVYDAGAQAFVRADDANTSTGQGQVSGGMFTFVEEGGAQADTGWVASQPDGPATLGTSNIVMTQFSAAGVINVVEGNGIDVSQFGVQYTVTASVDSATITNNGGSGAQLASRDVNNVGTGTVLTSQGSGSDAIWQGIDLSGTNTVLTGTLGVTDGGTGLNTIPQGSVLVANSADTLTALDGGASTPTVNQVLIYNFLTDQLEWQDASGISANAYGQVIADSGSATANMNSDQISIIGAAGAGISTTATDGTTDTLEIAVDFSTLSTVSVVAGTDQIIIDQGAGPVATTISDLIDDVVDTTVDRYNAITDGVNTETAAAGGDTITFTTGNGVALTVSNPDTVTADIDFSTLTSVSTITGTDQVIIDQGAGPVVTTLDDLLADTGPSYGTFNADTGTSTADTGSDTVTFAGTGGISTTATNGAPDTITIDLDFTTLPVGSAGSLDGTEQIIINDGGTNTVVTINDFIDANVVAYTTIGGDTGSAVAVTSTDTLNIIGATGAGIATTAADGAPDSLEIAIDFSTLTSVSTLAGTDQIIIDQGAGPVVTTLDEVFSDVAPGYGVIGADTGSVTATGTNDTVNIVGTGGIATTGAEGSPDTLTIDLDFTTLPVGSAGSIDGTEQIIINDGGTNTVVTINDFIDAAAPSFSTIALTGNTGAGSVDPVADAAEDTLGMVGGVGITLTGANDPESITIDFSSAGFATASVIDPADELVFFDSSATDAPTTISVADFISSNDIATAAYTTISDGVNTATASSPTDTLEVVPGTNGGISIVAAEGTPDTLTIDIDIPGLPNVSAGSIDGTEEIIINDGGTNQRATLNEIFQAAGVGVVGEDEVVATGGVNEAFVGFFSNTPIDDESITVFFNGLALRSTGWTRSGTTLTMVDAVVGYQTEAGDIISARYEY